MKASLPLSADKKLNVLYRIEPGCLGPDGLDHIDKFCQFAQQQTKDIDSDFVHWEIIPRYDKNLAEMEYRLTNKRLSHKQAAKYLSLFHKDLDQFEDHLHEKIGDLIEQFLGR